MSAPSARGGGLPDSWLRACDEPERRAAFAASVRAERLRAGLTDLAPLSAAFLKASTDARPEAAEGLASFAAEAAPTDPRTRWQLFLRAASAFRPAAALREGGAFLSAAAKDPWVQAAVGLRALTVLWAGALLTSFALLAVALTRFGPLFFHDYVDAFPPRFRRATPWVLGAFVSAALWTLGAGPWTGGALLAVCLAPYLPRRPRAALAVSLALSGALAPSLAWLGGFAGPTGERAWALYRAGRGDGGPELDRFLAEPSAEDAESLGARARLARAERRYVDAGQLWSRAEKAGWRHARLELGNVCLLANDLQAAAAEYKRAAAEEPGDARPWINLHLVELRRLALPQADEALEYAKRLDSEAESLLRSSGSFPVGSLPGGAPIREALLSAGGEERGWGKEVVRLLFWRPLALSPLYFGAAALAGILWGGLALARRRSGRCPGCGTRVCPRCSRTIKGSELCPACWALRTAKGRDATEREKQTRAVERWEERSRRWRRLARAVLPGWCEWTAGEGSAAALALGVLWSLCGGAVLLGLLYPAPVLPWSETGFAGAAFALFVVAYVVGLRRAVAKARSRR